MRRHQRTRTLSAPCSNPADFHPVPYIDRADKPFTCRYCPLTSSRRDAIIRHTRTFHPGQLLDSISKENEQANTVGNEVGPSQESPPLRDCSVLEDPVPVRGPVPSHSPTIETQPPFEMPPSPSDADLGSMDLSSWFQFNAGAVGLRPTSHETRVLSGDDTFATPQIDFDCAFDPQLLDLGILAPLDQLVHIGGMPQEKGHAQPMPAALPEAGTPTSDYEQRKDQTCLGITVDAHSRAKTKLLQLNGQEKLSGMQFPSRPAMVRFVKAYFTHMAPYVPVVHGPTFDVSSLPRK